MVTVNLCLGRSCVGAGLVFKGLVGQQDEQVVSLRYEHRPGVALMHLGDQLHYVEPLQSGERINLVLWMAGESFGGGPDFYDTMRGSMLLPQEP